MEEAGGTSLDLEAVVVVVVVPRSAVLGRRSRSLSQDRRVERRWLDLRFGLYAMVRIGTSSESTVERSRDVGFASEVEVARYEAVVAAGMELVEVVVQVVAGLALVEVGFVAGTEFVVADSSLLRVEELHMS